MSSVPQSPIIPGLHLGHIILNWLRADRQKKEFSQRRAMDGGKSAAGTSRTSCSLSLSPIRSRTRARTSSGTHTKRSCERRQWSRLAKICARWQQMKMPTGTRIATARGNTYSNSASSNNNKNGISIYNNNSNNNKKNKSNSSARGWCRVQRPWGAFTCECAELAKLCT